jgi:hypothetical protein
VANGLRRCSTSELSSARGTPSPDPRHTPRQCRAHRTGNKPAPLGIVHRCSALAPRRKRQSLCDCIRLPPVPKHPGTAHEAPSRVSLPRASKCPDASGARCNRVLMFGFPFASAKKKRPRVLEPEGVRVASGDRGDRSPRCERISRCGCCRSNSACRFRANAHRAVRTRAGPHRAWAMAAVQRCGRNASWDSCVLGIAGRRGGAPYARLFYLATNFLQHRRAVVFLQPSGNQ